MRKSVSDMTSGSPTRLMITFALPLMLGNIFQQMYTMTDAAIVGQFAGAEALGAIGSADWLCWLVFGVISGFMQGFSILIAQRFGAGDYKGMRRSVATSIVLAGAVVVFFTVLGLGMTKPLLRIMGTRAELFDAAAGYLYILYGGIIVTAVYNLLASILRALGNGRAPLIAMVAASVTNITLDLVFVIIFKWGVLGAAAATVIAQALAAVVCFLAIRRLDILKFEKGEFAFDKADSRTLIKLAFPMAFQNILICAGGMAVQTVINGLGFAFVTGFTATNKLYGLMEAAAISFGYAITTYAGQNLGAGKLDRIRSGMRSAALIGLIISLILTALIFLFGKYMLMLFIESSADPSVMTVALRYLRTMAATLAALYMLYVYRSALQGMGDTVMPMVSGLVEGVMRVGAAILLTRIMGESGIYYAESAAWIGAAVLLAISYFVRIKQFESGRKIA